MGIVRVDKLKERRMDVGNMRTWMAGEMAREDRTTQANGLVSSYIRDFRQN